VSSEIVGHEYAIAGEIVPQQVTRSSEIAGHKGAMDGEIVPQ